MVYHGWTFFARNGPINVHKIGTNRYWNSKTLWHIQIKNEAKSQLSFVMTQVRATHQYWPMLWMPNNDHQRQQWLSPTNLKTEHRTLNPLLLKLKNKHWAILGSGLIYMSYWDLTFEYNVIKHPSQVLIGQGLKTTCLGFYNFIFYEIPNRCLQLTILLAFTTKASTPVKPQ